MKAMKLLYRISNGMVYAISFVILAILTIKNLIFSTYVMNIKELIRIRNSNVWMTAVFMILLVLLFYLLFIFSERIDEKKLFLFFFLKFRNDRINNFFDRHIRRINKHCIVCLF